MTNSHTMKAETADLVSAAFAKSWQFVRTDPELGHDDSDAMRFRLSRHLESLAKYGGGPERFGSRQQQSNFRRSLEDFRLRQLDFGLQFPQLRYRRCSSRKRFACAPPGMAIQDVPFKRAVRARMPPHVEEPGRRHSLDQVKGASPTVSYQGSGSMRGTFPPCSIARIAFPFPGQPPFAPDWLSAAFAYPIACPFYHFA
jgi:hypothetical protein